MLIQIYSPFSHCADNSLERKEGMGTGHYSTISCAVKEKNGIKCMYNILQYIIYVLFGNSYKLL